MLHKYVDKAFIINLDRRSDRLDSATSRCKSIGLEFERFPAVDGSILDISSLPSAKDIGQPDCYWNKGAIGVCHSLINLLTHAKEQNYSSILIMEDDVEFHSQINQAVDLWMKDVPADWETLFFGANHNRPYTPITQNVIRLSGSYALHCHAVKNTMYDFIIDELKKMRNPADVVYANSVHPRGKSYCFAPNLAYQAISQSDITGQLADYSFLRK